MVKVKVFEDHDVVCRELMLIKVKATATTRSQIVQIADVYRGNVLDNFSYFYDYRGYR